MTEPFIPVTDEAALEDLFARSRREPIVLYLHDPYCFTSMLAEQEMADLTEPVHVHVVDVSRQQALSRRVAEWTGLRHESPQAFVLHMGQAVWSRSHGAVTADAVRQALRRCAVPVGSETA